MWVVRRLGDRLISQANIRWLCRRLHALCCMLYVTWVQGMRCVASGRGRRLLMLVRFVIRHGSRTPIAKSCRRR